MYRGALSFSAGIEVGNVNIKDFCIDKDWCERISVDFVENMILINISVNAPSEEKIDEVYFDCKCLCEDIVSRASFYFNAKTDRVVFVQGYFADETGNVVIYEKKEKQVVSLEIGWRVGCFGRTTEFDNFMRDESSGRNSFYSMYRHCLGVEDCVGKAMFLYNILMQLAKDSQSEVDKIIENEFPGIEKFESVKENGRIVNETGFTKFRNEICHTRDKRGFAIDCKKLKNDVAVFQGIVRKVIQNFPFCFIF